MHTTTSSLLSNLMAMGLKNHLISPILGNMKSLIPFSNLTPLDKSLFPDALIANDNKELS